jgi:hypothetical protein
VSKSGFDLLVEAIDAELDHLHKQRWIARASELHDEEDHAEGSEKERVKQKVREHYANRFRPETSRDAIIEQARKNYTGENAA